MVFENPQTLPEDQSQWKIVVVLPTRNESATILDVIEEIRSAFDTEGLASPTILITDDSTDETRKLAHAAGVHVVNGEGKGLGYAMQQGLKAALTLNPDIIVSMDSDGQSDPQEIQRFLTPLRNDVADMVLGSRFLTKDSVHYRYPWINRFGTLVLSWLLRRITKLPITDSHGGLRAMRPNVVHSLDIIGTHTYVQESIIDAHKKGYRVVEVPSAWRVRKSGRSRVVGSIVRYVMYTLPVLVIRGDYHIRVLYKVALGLVLLAHLLFLSLIWQADFVIASVFLRIPALILVAVMVMVGTQLFTLGFLTEIVGLVKLRVDRLGRGSKHE